MGVIIGNPTQIRLGGVDLSGFIKDAGFEMAPWQQSILDTLPWRSMTLDFRAPRSFTFRATWDQLHPETRSYLRRLFAEAAAARKRRLSRMRSAYRAKRGRK